MNPSSVDLASLRDTPFVSQETVLGRAARFDWRTWWPLMVIGALGVGLLMVFIPPLLESPRMVAIMPVVVKEDTVARGATTGLQISGWVEPAPFAYTVRSVLPGVIREIRVLEGSQVVAQETVLARLDTSLIDWQIKEAESELATMAAEAAAAATRVRQTQTRLTANRAAAIKLAEVQAKVAELERQKELVAQRLQVARAELAENVAAQADLAAKHERVAALRREQADLTTRLQIQLVQLGALERSAKVLRELATNKSGSELAAVKAEADVEVARRDANGLRARLHALKDERQAASTALALAARRVAQPLDLLRNVAEAEVEQAGVAKELAAARQWRDLLQADVAEPLDVLAEYALADAEMIVRTQAAANATTRLEALRAQRTLHEIRAPISGEVLELLASPGDSAAEICRLYDPTRLQIRVEVPLHDVAAIRLTMPVEITCDAVPNRVMKGVAERFVRSANVQRNSLQLKVRVDDPAAKDLLRPEMLTRCKFVAPTSTPSETQTAKVNRYFVPRQAVMVVNGSPSVWLFDPRGVTVGEGRAMAVAVTMRETADAPPNFVEVSGPLTPSAHIIVHGGAELRNGTRVIATDHNSPTGPTGLEQRP